VGCVCGYISRMARAVSDKFQNLLPRCNPSCVNVNMALPAHQPVLKDDTDEELSDEQVRELLNEAERRMRAKQAASSPIATDAPFKLPKLKPGHVADSYLKTEGGVRQLDTSKLINQKERVLAYGIKKIEDPVQVKKQKAEVCTAKFHSSADDDNYPIFYNPEQTRVPFWVPSCIVEGTFS
jgi:hypothetical protein